jgi:hypothetical protein
VSSEVIAEQSLGYGEYRIVVQNTAGLDPNVVFGLFLWDTSAPELQNREIDIEVSRWGVPGDRNAQCVLQPYTKAGHRARFQLPAGRAEVMFRWSPSRLLCRASVGGRIVFEHLFTEGVPEPGHEKVRLNLWLYRMSPPVDGKPVGVVVEQFRFSPFDRKGK